MDSPGKVAATRAWRSQSRAERSQRVKPDERSRVVQDFRAISDMTVFQFSGYQIRFYGVFDEAMMPD